MDALTLVSAQAASTPVSSDDEQLSINIIIAVSVVVVVVIVAMVLLAIVIIVALVLRAPLLCNRHSSSLDVTTREPAASPTSSR